jgi:hypothetical protein
MKESWKITLIHYASNEGRKSTIETHGEESRYRDRVWKRKRG